MSQCPIGYAIAKGRSAIFSSHATERDIMKFKQEKFDPMVESSPVIRDKIAGGKSGHKGKNNTIIVSYVDGHLTFAHSHSPSAMRSSTAMWVFADEVEEYPGTTDTNDPLVALIARTLGYGKRAKVMLISSPKAAEITIIGKQFEKGDGREYYVPCAHCNEPQTFTRESIEYTETGNYRTLYLLCKYCGMYH